MARVLVVDDQDYLLKDFVEVLRDEHEIVWVRTARAGVWALQQGDPYEPDLDSQELVEPEDPAEVAALSADSYGLLLLDLLLPVGATDHEVTREENGRELGARLLAWAREEVGLAAPVIVVSAYLDKTMSDRLAELDAVEILEKPCSADDLMAAVKRALA